MSSINYMRIFSLLLSVPLSLPLLALGTPARAEVATVYAGYYNGAPTASGELYSDQKLTAAHPSLPLGSYVRVSYGDRSVVVKINDRCGCDIDLSLAAAQVLGFGRNTRRVTVERVSGPDAGPQAFYPAAPTTIGRLPDGAGAAIEFLQGVGADPGQ